MIGNAVIDGFEIRFNIYARIKIAEFLMDGMSPFPHPVVFESRVAEYYRTDKNELIHILFYCGYLGRQFQRGNMTTLKFSEFRKPTDNDSVWIEFMNAEGYLLEYDNPFPKSDDGSEFQRFETIVAYAFGEMGLKPREFYDMTFAEFELASAGHFRKRWRPDEHLRELKMLIQNVFRSKNTPAIRHPENLYYLPTDQNRKKKHSPEKIREMWSQFKDN